MLRLVMRGAGPIPIEADAIAPDRLAAMTPAQIASLTLYHGNREVPLGDIFRSEGDAADGNVVIEGDCACVKSLGRGMAAGTLIVRGPAGMHAGAGMVGGRLEVHGDAGDWLGAEMRSGFITVRGRAGDLVGAAYRGASKGMRGGVILIDGDAGDEAGANMRRGLIAVGGRCGEFTGASMIAGSIFAFGGVGLRPGSGMKRGSIVVLGGMLESPPTFRRGGDFDPVFVEIYLRQLRAWGFAAAAPHAGRLYSRFSGDLLALGEGEILHALPS
jgi:formylmethanofuran dehydrogenase subunit C